MRLILIALWLSAQAPDRPRTFRGCIDEQNGSYVLTDDHELKPIAVLHGDGFADDNFAKDLGHKVSIEGSRREENGTPVIRVKKVTTLSETCEASGDNS